MCYDTSTIMSNCLVKTLMDYRKMDYHCQIDSATINMAEKVGYSPATIDYLRETQHSTTIEDAVRHRWIQTYLLQNHGFKSETYKINCEIIHKYDKEKY